MRRTFYTLWTSWALLAASTLIAQGRVEEHIHQLRDRGVRFQPVDLFAIVPSTPAIDARWSDALAKAAVLRMDGARISALLDQRPEHVALVLPTAEGEVVLDLERTDLTTDDFVVRTASGGVQPRPEGLHYRGSIRNTPRSIAAISVFPEGVMGLLSDDSGERVIGRFEDDAEGLHVLYHERDLLIASTTTCDTPDDAGGYERSKLGLDGAPKTIRCVRYYWEVNYDIFQNKGSVVNAVNYVTGLFNQSAILFANDGIDVTLSEVFVWDVPSPYTQTSTSALLDQFGITRTSFNGDMAHLLGFAGGGGIAWRNTLCNSQTRFRMAYSDINSTYANVPTYSWSVMVVSHEQGHNLGSRHTHACSWNGNNTAIDGCGPTAGYTEGTCPTGPLPTGTGGTIMSYCHLVGSVGINFNTGFGPQPTAVMVNAVNGASCLTACGTSCDPPGNLTVGALTTSSATLSWSAVGVTNYTLQWKPAASGTWTTVAGLTTNTYNLTGLSASTAYEFRVLSVCGAASSAYSPVQPFSTPAPCPDALEPNNTVATAAPIILPASVSALVASSSDADHYAFTIATTSTINVYLSGLVADYDVRLLNSGGTQLAISQNGGTNAESISFSNAVPGTYVVHAYGFNGAFSSTMCYALSVSAFAAQGCNAPDGTQVSGITYNGATVSWPAVQGASGYELRWKPSLGSTWTTVSGLTATTYSLAGLGPVTSYDVQVRSVCPGGGTQGGTSAYGTLITFTTLAAPCEVAPPIRVAIKVMLDGPYRAQTGLMVDSLRTKGLLPLQEPYTALGYSLAGGATTTLPVLAITGPNAIVDWIVVELRDPGTYAVVEARAALLQRDGDVVAVDGSSPLGFCSAAGNYRVAVRHRNHLGCMTGALYALSATLVPIDLSQTSTATYGTNARKANGSLMNLWSGNVLANGFVSYTGTDNDRDPILNAIGGVSPTNTVVAYSLADVNMDGAVIYTGNGNDRDLILSNIGGTVPTLSVPQQLP